MPQDVKLLSYVNETGWFGEGNRLLIVQASNIEGNILFDESKYTHKLVQKEIEVMVDLLQKIKEYKVKTTLKNQTVRIMKKNDDTLIIYHDKRNKLYYIFELIR